MGDFLLELIVLIQFLIFSHAVKKLINALLISKKRTIHIFELRSAILRTRYTPHGGFPWGIFPHGGFHGGFFHENQSCSFSFQSFHMR